MDTSTKPDNDPQLSLKGNVKAKNFRSAKYRTWEEGLDLPSLPFGDQTQAELFVI